MQLLCSFEISVSLVVGGILEKKLLLAEQKPH